jgi:putative DNA-invertase from lambdoid prophage Rac
MSRVFGYARVSTANQVTENQRAQIEQAGYSILPRRFVEEQISGGMAALKRPGFAALLDRLEEGDTLVVTKLDRLGRDSIDVQQTVQMFQTRAIRLVVLQLGNLDITSSSGELMIKMLAAVADFERDLIIERTQVGLARAKAEGKRLGRPSKTTKQSREEIVQALNHGKTVSELARAYGISRALVHSIRTKALAGGVDSIS